MNRISSALERRRGAAAGQSASPSGNAAADGRDKEGGPHGIIVETDIPARLDGLAWGPFHTLVVIALGITWILDGLEVTLTGALSGVLKENSGLGLTNTEVGLASSAYLAGAVLGALLFGWLTDRLGRKKLFFTTLAVYLAATAATALSWNFASFALFRALTGAGIGGEYSAIASTIQELIPARFRGFTDLVINGSFWIGAAIGAAGSIVLLDPASVDPAIGWRLAFLIGAVLGLGIFVMRFWLPESPRWLMTHGQAGRAEAIVVVSSRQTTLNRARILELARSHKLPLVGGWGPWAQGGALFSYGPDLDPIVRLAATYVDKILKGAKPADLPVVQSTKFEFVINLPTARALGIEIPNSLQLLADEVIE